MINKLEIMEAMEDEKAKEFIKEIIEVYKKHGLSIGHEDIGGSFLVNKKLQENICWLEAAYCYDS